MGNQIYRNKLTQEQPLPANMKEGELAVVFIDGALYTKDDNDNITLLGTPYDVFISSMLKTYERIGKVDQRISSDKNIIRSAQFDYEVISRVKSEMTIWKKIMGIVSFLREMGDRFKAIEERLDRLENPVPTVLFVQTTKHHVSPGVYTYDRVQVDTKMSYNSDTYEYTVPETGYYQLYLTGHIAYKDDDVYRFRIRRNKSNIGPQMRLTTKAAEYAATSLNFSYYLKRGDVIDVTLSVDGGHSDYAGLDYSGFGLFKIT